MKAPLAALVLTAWVAAALGQPRESMFVAPFGFSDSSGEPLDQRAVHQQRLSAMSSELKAELQKEGRYQIVESPAGAAPCPEGATACLLKQAQDAGADLILAGAVHKTSTMESLAWVGLFDARDGKQVSFRQLTFRGDTDESWRRAASFIGRDIGGNPPAPP